jgi:hypothetical protein
VSHLFFFLREGCLLFCLKTFDSARFGGFFLAQTLRRVRRRRQKKVTRGRTAYTGQHLHNKQLYNNWEDLLKKSLGGRHCSLLRLRHDKCTTVAPKKSTRFVCLFVCYSRPPPDWNTQMLVTIKVKMSPKIWLSFSIVIMSKELISVWKQTNRWWSSLRALHFLKGNKRAAVGTDV